MKKKVAGLVVIGLFVAAWLLYARSQVKPIENGPVAAHINCINNLKQIAIAFRTWNGDHNGQFPFNVSTNVGGTMEFSGPDKEGFDRNAYLHLKVMSMDGELNTPLLLICPQDSSKKPAADWESLTAENITYRFRSGTNINLSGPREILAICPIDGNILYSDGSVVESKQSIESNPDGQHSMHVP